MDNWYKSSFQKRLIVIEDNLNLRSKLWNVRSKVWDVRSKAWNIRSKVWNEDFI